MTTSCSGRSFQIGRPSRIPYIRFIARPNAPTYPDADHSADARPMTNANPAARCAWPAPSAGCSTVRTTEPAPACRSTSSSVCTVCGPCPTSPTREISAIAAGNIASTA